LRRTCYDIKDLPVLGTSTLAHYYIFRTYTQTYQSKRLQIRSKQVLSR